MKSIENIKIEDVFPDADEDLVEANPKKDSRLLLEGPAIPISLMLARILGKSQAIFIQQLHYLLKVSEISGDPAKYRDGRWWNYNTYEKWRDEQHLPMSKRTIQRAALDLEEKGLIRSARMDRNPWNRTKWYTIEYDILKEYIRKAILSKSEVE